MKSARPRGRPLKEDNERLVSIRIAADRIAIELLADEFYQSAEYKAFANRKSTNQRDLNAHVSELLSPTRRKSRGRPLKPDEHRALALHLIANGVSVDVAIEFVMQKRRKLIPEDRYEDVRERFAVIVRRDIQKHEIQFAQQEPLNWISGAIASGLSYDQAIERRKTNSRIGQTISRRAKKSVTN